MLQSFFGKSRLHFLGGTSLDTPLLTHEVVAGFRRNVTQRANLRKSFERILTVPGLAMNGARVVGGPKFFERIHDVGLAPNHNWLRVVRILTSLILLGLETENPF